MELVELVSAWEMSAILSKDRRLGTFRLLRPGANKNPLI